jgi:hypothetical protein
MFRDNCSQKSRTNYKNITYIIDVDNICSDVVFTALTRAENLLSILLK